ncbi:hypothetical protein NCS52_01055000 [Fusarium sp. LHS14.1]|nr:hypothetical protein NCS52_01055000 [Fusarium sp. LHS14.1]
MSDYSESSSRQSRRGGLEIMGNEMTISEASSHRSRHARSDSSRAEIRNMMKSIERKRGSTDEHILAVVRARSVEGLLEKYNQSQPSSRKLIGRGKERAAVTVTCLDHLQAWIEHITNIIKCRKIKIIVSCLVDDLNMHIEKRVRKLELYRCGYGENADLNNFVTGWSTYRGIRFDEWDGQGDKELWFGPGIAIKVDPRRSNLWSPKDSSFTANNEDKDTLRRYFEGLQSIPMEGNWWQKWKSAISLILGVLGGGAKLAVSMNVTAAGAYIHYQSWTGSSVKLGCGGMKASMEASGGAVLVGAGVAAAVYFIPWDVVLGWMDSLFSWLWEGFKSMVSKFWEWMKSFWASNPTKEQQMQVGIPRPMGF